MTDPKQTPLSSRRYAVFISYRHADNKEPGRQWATWLHHLLEGYEIPADLVGKENSRGDRISPSLYPVFRDEEELPADADLTRNIRQALENSELLVVICSPRAVESRFVADEIRYFKTLGKLDRILALMIDGEPNASDDPGKARMGIEPEAECLPEPLRFGVVTVDGAIDWSQRTEPIAADVRPEGRPEQGWTTGAAFREALQKREGSGGKDIARKVHEYEQRLELAKLKVVAGSLGVPLGELTRRDKALQLEKARKRARTLRRWLLVVGILTACAISAGILAILKARAEREQRLLAQEATAKVQQAEGVIQKDAIAAHESASTADLSVAESRINEGDPSGALPYLADAMRQNPENHAAIALTVSILRVEPHIQTQLRYSAPVTSASFSQDGGLVVTNSGGHWRLWEIRNRAPAGVKELGGAAAGYAEFVAGGNGLIVEKQEGAAWSVQLRDPRTGRAAGLAVKSSDPPAARSLSQDGSRVLILSVKVGQNWGGQVWDLHTGKLVRELSWSPQPGQDGEVPIGALSPDGNRAVMAADDKVRVYDVATGEQVGKTAETGDTVKQLELSEGGKRLLIVWGGDSDNVTIWDVDAGKALGQGISYYDLIHFAALSPNGEQVITVLGGQFERGAVSEKVQAQIWDAATGEAVGNPLTHYGQINSAQYSPDGRWIVTASDDKTARIWDARTGDPVGLPMHHAAKVNSARFSPDGKWVITASDDNTAQIWMAQTGYGFDEAARYPERNGFANFSPDGQRMVTGSTEKNDLRIWDLKSGKVVVHAVFASRVLSASFNADGSRVLNLYTGKEPETVMVHPKAAQIWDAQTGRPIGAPMPGISSARFSPDGKLVLAASLDGLTRIWDAATGKPAGPALQSSQWLVDGTYSSDGKEVAAGCGYGRLCIWELQAPPSAWREIGFVRPQAGTLAVEFSPDGKLLRAVSDAQAARVWDVPSLRPVASPALSGGPIDAAAFTPDGKGLLTVIGSVAQIWDLKSGAPLTEPMQHATLVGHTAFTSDGRWLMTAPAQGVVQIWEAQTGDAVSLPFDYREGYQFFWTFDPNAEWAYGDSYDFSSARLWDGMTDAAEAPPWLADLAEAVSGLRVSPNGTVQPSASDAKALIQVLGSLSGSDDLSRFGRWFVNDPWRRTISPRSVVAVPEFVAQCLRENSADALEEAYLIDPGNPLLMASLAKFEKDKEQALFLCRHALGRARVESSPQTVAQVLTIARSIFPNEPEFSNAGGASPGSNP